MNNYTPTTENVRNDFTQINESELGTEGAKEGFDRWLNKELAKAWDEGHEVLCEDVDYICERFHPNPYRKVEE